MGEPRLSDEIPRGHGGSILAGPIDDNSVVQELFRPGETGEKGYQINKYEDDNTVTTKNYNVRVANVPGTSAAMVTVSRVLEDTIEDYDPIELAIEGNYVFGDLWVRHSIMGKDVVV